MPPVAPYVNPLRPAGPLAAVIVAALVGLFLATVPLETAPQIWLAWLLMGLVLAPRLLPRNEMSRILLFTIGTFATVRYFWWRTFETINWHDPLSFSVAILLYAAELYGMIIFLLGMLTNLQELRRAPCAPHGPPEAWPTVDVMIPTYDEDPALVAITIIAATQLRYPSDRLQVWICDDGGTDQKLNDHDLAKAAAASDRVAALKAACELYGARYHARERNEHAKAGNLNAAFAHATGEIVMILDADHIPAVDFLERTVGFMQDDPDVFLVQTPHFFVNADPFEKNHALFGRVPAENEMFYRVIQPGLDFWNSAFFCGSAALLRRKHLDEVGGIAGMSITEDAETALELHARGYRSVYLDRPMISGLQPETYAGFVVQRIRWAQGMAQILLLKNPLFKRGLRWYQRINYFGSCFFWLFGFARLAFLLAPLAYLTFGLKIYDATPTTFFAFAVPYLIATIVVSDHLYGHVRGSLVSGVYELLQAAYIGPALVRVLMKPRAPSFKVTPKGEVSDHDYVSSLAAPFYVMFLVVMVGMASAAIRWTMVPAERAIIGITLVWNTLNLIYVNAALGALYELRQRRTAPRMPLSLPGKLVVAGQAQALTITDLSVGGAALTLAAAPPGFERGTRFTLEAVEPATGRLVAIDAEAANVRPSGDGGLVVGAHFVLDSPDARRVAVLLAHGDSERWVAFQGARDKYHGIFASIGFLLDLAFRPNFRRMRALLANALSYLRLHLPGRPARPAPHAEPSQG